MENKIYLTVDTLKRKYTSLFAHELSYMLLHQMDINKAPEWLKEGMAMYFAAKFIKTFNLKKNANRRRHFQAEFPTGQKLSTLQSPKPKEKHNLMHAFLIVKYLITQYGWSNFERFVKKFESGTHSTADAIWDVYHIKYRKFLMDFDMYMISRHFFKTS